MAENSRYDRIYAVIAKYHRKSFPDMRVGQLFDNLRGYVRSRYGEDIYYVENGKFIKYLEEFAEEQKTLRDKKDYF